MHFLRTDPVVGYLFVHVVAPTLGGLLGIVLLLRPAAVSPVSPMETPGHIERMARRLLVMVADLKGHDDKLRTASWTDEELEDIRLARAGLHQAIGLLERHARRWRRGGDK